MPFSHFLLWCHSCLKWWFLWFPEAVLSHLWKDDLRFLPMFRPHAYHESLRFFSFCCLLSLRGWSKTLHHIFVMPCVWLRVSWFVSQSWRKLHITSPPPTHSRIIESERREIPFHENEETLDLGCLCFQLLSFSSHRATHLSLSLAWVCHAIISHCMSWQGNRVELRRCSHERRWWCEEHDCESGAKKEKKFYCTVCCKKYRVIITLWKSSLHVPLMSEDVIQESSTLVGYDHHHRNHEFHDFLPFTWKVQWKCVCNEKCQWTRYPVIPS